MPTSLSRHGFAIIFLRLALATGATVAACRLMGVRADAPKPGLLGHTIRRLGALTAVLVLPLLALEIGLGGASGDGALAGRGGPAVAGAPKAGLVHDPGSIALELDEADSRGVAGFPWAMGDRSGPQSDGAGVAQAQPLVSFSLARVERIGIGSRAPGTMDAPGSEGDAAWGDSHAIGGPVAPAPRDSDSPGVRFAALGAFSHPMTERANWAAPRDPATPLAEAPARLEPLDARPAPLSIRAPRVRRVPDPPREARLVSRSSERLPRVPEAGRSQADLSSSDSIRRDDRVVANAPFRIQLGAFGSVAEAEENLAALAREHPDLLSDLSFGVFRARIDRKVYYRLRAGPFAARAGAERNCAELGARGVDCMVWSKLPE